VLAKKTPAVLGKRPRENDDKSEGPKKRPRF